MGDEQSCSSPLTMRFDETNGSLGPSATPSHDYWLPLDARALIQPLGVENSWQEVGDGRVELDGMTLRVVSFGRAPPNGSIGSDAAAIIRDQIADGDSSCVADDRSVLIEDVLMEDTPLVGDNLCIVWNAVDQQLSMCIMFFSEASFAATWAAIHAAQKQEPLPLLEHLGEYLPDPRVDLEVVFSRWVLPSISLQQIERYVLAACICEGNLLSECSELFFPPPDHKSPLAPGLFTLGNVELIEKIVMSGLGDDETSPKGMDMYSSYFEQSVRALNRIYYQLDSNDIAVPLWQPPESLSSLPLSLKLQRCLNAALRVQHLRNEVLPHGGFAISRLPSAHSAPPTPEEVFIVLDALTHRLLNEVLLGILLDDENNILLLAVTELFVLPDGHRVPDVELPAKVAEAARACNTQGSTETQNSDRGVVLDPKNHVVGFIKFFKSVVDLAISAHSKDLIAAVTAKIFAQGLLPALNFVSREYSNVGGSPSQSDVEIVAFLDVVVIRLNEQGEEAVLNEIFRNPIVESSAMYNDLMSLLARAALLSRDFFINCHPEKTDDVTINFGFSPSSALLFHLLGHHDDEGATCERFVDPLVNADRDAFHAHFIKQTLEPILLTAATVVESPATESEPHILKSSRFELSSSRIPIWRRLSRLSASTIRIVEYLLLLCSLKNKELLLAMLLHSGCILLPWIEACGEAALAAIHLGSVFQCPGDTGLLNIRVRCSQEVLCGNIRCMRAIFQCCAPWYSPTGKVSHLRSIFGTVSDCDAAVMVSPGGDVEGPATTDESPALLFAKQWKNFIVYRLLLFWGSSQANTRGSRSRRSSRVGDSQSLTNSTILESYLRIFKCTGGARKQSTLHATMFSLLFLLQSDVPELQCPSLFGEQSHLSVYSGTLQRLDILRAAREAILKKHRNLLPSRFLAQWDDESLRFDQHTCAKMLTAEDTTGNQSTAVSGLCKNLRESSVENDCARAEQECPLPAMRVSASPPRSNSVGVGAESPSGQRSPARSAGSTPPRRIVDEVGHDVIATDVSPAKLEDVAAFPKRLRTMMSRLSPTPPQRDEVPSSSHSPGRVSPAPPPLSTVEPQMRRRFSRPQPSTSNDEVATSTRPLVDDVAGESKNLPTKVSPAASPPASPVPTATLVDEKTSNARYVRARYKAVQPGSPPKTQQSGNVRAQRSTSEPLLPPDMCITGVRSGSADQVLAPRQPVTSKPVSPRSQRMAGRGK